MMNFIPGIARECSEPAEPDEVLVALWGDKLVMRQGALPTGRDAAFLEQCSVSRLLLGELYGRPCSLIQLPPEQELPDSVTACELREARLALDDATEIAVCRGREIAFWRRNHVYCGRCGGALTDLSGECARKCNACGAVFYPVISPAVIVAVTDDAGRLLLAHNAKFRNNMHGLIAGFVEPGETMEQAIVRECREEVGIEVGDIVYYASQSWPYPNSLMAGFTARLKSGVVTPDGVEILSADFFAPDALPVIPQPGSIARELIDRWLAEYQNHIVFKKDKKEK